MPTFCLIGVEAGSFEPDPESELLHQEHLEHIIQNKLAIILLIQSNFQCAFWTLGHYVFGISNAFLISSVIKVWMQNHLYQVYNHIFDSSRRNKNASANSQHKTYLEKARTRHGPENPQIDFTKCILFASWLSPHCTSWITKASPKSEQNNTGLARASSW